MIPPEADAEFVAHMEQVLDPMRNRTTRLARSCAWRRCNWSRKRARRWPPRWRGPAASTTSTNGPVRPRSSCSASRWRVGGGRRRGPGGRRRTGRWRSPVGGPLRRLPESHPGVRQPQHAHARRLLRGVRAGPGSGTGSSPRVLLHAEARELAEHRRERTEFDDAPMPARRRIGDLETLHGEVSAWSTDVTATMSTCRDARRKLKSVYPNDVTQH